MNRGSIFILILLCLSICFNARASDNMYVVNGYVYWENQGAPEPILRGTPTPSPSASTPSPSLPGTQPEDVVSDTKTTAVLDAPELKESGYYVTEWDNVPLRASANVYAEALEWLPRHTVVYVCDALLFEEKIWYTAANAELTGYIRSDLLRPITEDEIEKYAKESGVFAKQEDIVAVSAPDDPNANSGYGYVADNDVNLCTMPGGAWIKTLGQYILVFIYKSQAIDDVIWYQINENGNIGWVRGDCLHRLSLAGLDGFIGSDDYFRGRASLGSMVEDGQYVSIPSVEDWNVHCLESEYEFTYNPMNLYGISASFAPTTSKEAMDKRSIQIASNEYGTLTLDSYPEIMLDPDYEFVLRGIPGDGVYRYLSFMPKEECLPLDFSNYEASFYSEIENVEYQYRLESYLGWEDITGDEIVVGTEDLVYSNAWARVSFPSCDFQIVQLYIYLSSEAESIDSDYLADLVKAEALRIQKSAFIKTLDHYLYENLYTSIELAAPDGGNERIEIDTSDKFIASCDASGVTVLHGDSDIYYYEIGISTDSLDDDAFVISLSDGTPCWIDRDNSIYYYIPITQRADGTMVYLCIYIDSFGASDAQEIALVEEILSATYLPMRKAAQTHVPTSSATPRGWNGSSYQYILFGEFTQASELQSPILWRILQVTDNRALLLSEYILEARIYDYSHSDWIRSDAKKWLNRDFLRKAFSSENVFNALVSDNEIGTVFLLSKEDYLNEQYGFSPDEEVHDSAKRAKGTSHAISNGLFVDGDGYSNYYTRKTYDSFKDAVFVWQIRSTGKGVLSKDNWSHEGMRPAIWVDLDQLSLTGTGEFDSPYRINE